MNEIWKDIEGYEGLYQVSDLGKVKSLNYNNTGKERILKQGKHRCGYLQVNLYKDGNRKQYTIQRLVAYAFIPNPENKPEVNHKDENKENNCVWNLEWCDRKYNQEYSKGKKIICVETNKVYPSAHEAERQTCINNGNIIKCCQGKRNTAGGYRWRFYDC